MRLAAREQVPEHYERLTLSGLNRFVLWGLAAALAAAGITMHLSGPRGSAVSTLGGVVLLAAAVSAVAAYHLRAHELTVTRSTVRAGFGPFARVLPRWSVGSCRSRPATSWRRLYCETEAAIEVDSPQGRSVTAIPACDLGELAALLAPQSEAVSTGPPPRPA